MIHVSRSGAHTLHTDPIAGPVVVSPVVLLASLVVSVVVPIVAVLVTSGFAGITTVGGAVAPGTGPPVDSVIKTTGVAV